LDLSNRISGGARHQHRGADDPLSVVILRRHRPARSDREMTYSGATFSPGRQLSVKPRGLRTRNAGKQIAPIRIVALDQCNLPGALPFFQTLLAMDRELDLIERFEIDQPVNPVVAAEAGAGIRPMFMDAPHEIVGYADIERATNIARQDIDPIGLALPIP
jgi:hypothetical protein